MKAIGLLLKMVRYNMKIIFGNKFIYFLLGATAFDIFLLTVNIFEDFSPDASTVFAITLFPSILLIFYPTVFGIQNDDDARILEILFGIPNYRYKVWLVRLIMIFALSFFVIIGFSYLASLAVYPVEIFTTAFHIMFPIIFLGCTSFMVSTMVRSGNGTAVVMIILGIGFMISSEALQYSSWNLFLNVYDMPSEGTNQVAWQRTVLYNRIYLLVGATLTTLVGLMNMQRREKFV